MDSFSVLRTALPRVNRSGLYNSLERMCNMEPSLSLSLFQRRTSLTVGCGCTARATCRAACSWLPSSRACASWSTSASTSSRRYSTNRERRWRSWRKNAAWQRRRRSCYGAVSLDVLKSRPPWHIRSVGLYLRSRSPISRAI